MIIFNFLKINIKIFFTFWISFLLFYGLLTTFLYSSLSAFALFLFPGLFVTLLFWEILKALVARCLGCRARLSLTVLGAITSIEKDTKKVSFFRYTLIMFSGLF